MGFNGAATSSLRKALDPDEIEECRPCFNGAATSSLRKAGGIVPSGQAYSGFNGAATSSLRKVLIRVDAKATQEELQWGRNFIVAERG